MSGGDAEFTAKLQTRDLASRAGELSGNAWLGGAELFCHTGTCLRDSRNTYSTPNRHHVYRL